MHLRARILQSLSTWWLHISFNVSGYWMCWSHINMKHMANNINLWSYHNHDNHKFVCMISEETVRCSMMMSISCPWSSKNLQSKSKINLSNNCLCTPCLTCSPTPDWKRQSEIILVIPPPPLSSTSGDNQDRVNLITPPPPLS